MAAATADIADCTHCYNSVDWPRTSLERVQACSVVDAPQQPAQSAAAASCQIASAALRALHAGWLLVAGSTALKLTPALQKAAALCLLLWHGFLLLVVAGIQEVHSALVDTVLLELTVQHMCLQRW